MTVFLTKCCLISIMLSQDNCADRNLRWCPGAKTSEEFKDCIEIETFNNSATARQGIAGNHLNPSAWTWDVTAAIDGRCFTLNFDQLLSIDISVDSLVFDLDKKMTYYLFLHQPDFFLVTYNPLTMPTVDMVLNFKDIGENYMTLFLEVCNLRIQMNMIPRIKSMRMNRMRRISAMKKKGVVRILCRFSDTRNWPRRAQGVKRTQSMIFLSKNHSESAHSLVRFPNHYSQVIWGTH